MSITNKLTADILIEVPKQFINLRMWRNNRIDAMAVGRGGKLRRVQAGVDGQGDVSGIIGPSGRRLEIEVKAPGDDMRTTQEAFKAMIEKLGGLYIIARSTEDVTRGLLLNGVK